MFIDTPLLKKRFSLLFNQEKTVVALSLGIFFVTALRSSGFHQIDEHFQILEFAAFKLGLTNQGELPWEYSAQMRPALQPAIVVLIYKINIIQKY